MRNESMSCCWRERYISRVLKESNITNQCMMLDFKYVLHTVLKCNLVNFEIPNSFLYVILCNWVQLIQLGEKKCQDWVVTLWRDNAILGRSYIPFKVFLCLRRTLQCTVARPIDKDYAKNQKREETFFEKKKSLGSLIQHLKAFSTHFLYSKC